MAVAVIKDSKDKRRREKRGKECWKWTCVHRTCEKILRFALKISRYMKKIHLHLFSMENIWMLFRISSFWVANKEYFFKESQIRKIFQKQLNAEEITYKLMKQKRLFQVLRKLHFIRLTKKHFFLSLDWLLLPWLTLEIVSGNGREGGVKFARSGGGGSHHHRLPWFCCRGLGSTWLLRHLRGGSSSLNNCRRSKLKENERNDDISIIKKNERRKKWE